MGDVSACYCLDGYPSDLGLGLALEGAEAVPFLIEDRYNLLNGVLEEGLTELEPSNILLGGKCDPTPNLWALIVGTRLII